MLCKSLSTVESLGAVNVIASDKTGTLTQNLMTAVNVALASGKKLAVADALKDDNSDEFRAIESLASIAGLCNDATVEEEKSDKINGDATGVLPVPFGAKILIHRRRRTLSLFQPRIACCKSPQ